jgi:phosphoglycerol transferase MdoB-like AlkP superfamily enzyme
MERLAAAARYLARALDYLPALVCACLCLRVAELAHARAAGLSLAPLATAAFADDLLSLARHAFVLLLAALPIMLVPSPRWRIGLLGAAWSLLLCAQAGLVQYHWVAGVPLGADLFAYSMDEARTTVAGHASFSGALVAALAVALFVLWGMLWLRERSARLRAGRWAGAVTAAASALTFFVLPAQINAELDDAGMGVALNKTAFFVDASLARLAPSSGNASIAAGAWLGEQPGYPFLHRDRTPDTLGPLLQKHAGTPPKLVFIIVEGLGRTFSGPGARLGSFTPFLDELAGRSLYWENFLSGQGRTFGVLPTVFGSLPFGENGFAALGERMPRHDSMLSVLKSQGYRLRFYTGSDAGFDNEAGYLRREGVDDIVSERDFGAAYKRGNEWGYADADLLDMTVERQQGEPAGPSVSIIQTTSMHSPFTFPGRDAWIERVRQRVAQLGLAKGAQAAYDAHPEIFASVLYTDDALRRYFERAASLPGYANTIFIITGDHRLPELPMDTRLERYHVPLIVFSPMLAAPRSMKAVSSQFDIAPSLLAYLGHQYQLNVPPEVTFLGTGLDTHPGFRNLHAVPLKQTKTELSDFISGGVYLAQGRQYALGDGLHTDRIDDTAAVARARAQFAAFASANAALGKGATLAPDAALETLAAFDGVGRTLRSLPLASEAGSVAVADVRAMPGAGGLAVEASFTNQAGTASQMFTPLLVLSDANGREVGEVTGKAQKLAGDAAGRVALTVDTRRLASGLYFVSVLPAHPDTGRPVGVGQYHVEVRL